MTAARPLPAIASMAGALALFVARPLLPGGATGVLALFGALLILGAAWPLDGKAPDRARSVLLPLAGGLIAFGLGRLLGGHSPTPTTTRYAAGMVFAAVAEELFFRRFVYAVLRARGDAVAVGGSSVLFAVAHVTVYGWWVLPLDLAAGMILGWQRWASGTWVVPAATHVAANLLVVL